MLLFKGRNRVTSGYRLPDRPDHNGLDIVGDDSTDVLCPVSGTVRSSTMITDKNDPTWEWGNYVRVDDADGSRLFFCHLASRAVSVGQKVNPGDKLGVMGNTGYSFGAHTHFEVRKSDGKTTLDPAAYLGIPNAKGTYSEGKTGWVQAGKSWYWYEDGAPVMASWRQIDGKWYYLGEDGRMVDDLQTIDGKEYFFFTESAGGRLHGEMAQTDETGALQ